MHNPIRSGIVLLYIDAANGGQERFGKFRYGFALIIADFQQNSTAGQKMVGRFRSKRRVESRPSRPPAKAERLVVAHIYIQPFIIRLVDIGQISNN